MRSRGSSGIEMEEKCCGNCKWFRRGKVKDTGDCDWTQKNYKLPDSIFYYTVWMYETEGEFCQCWKPRKTIQVKNEESISST